MVVGISPTRFRQTSGRATPRAQLSRTRSLACPRSDRPSDPAPDREEPLAEPDRERVLTRAGSAERHPARSRLANPDVEVVPATMNRRRGRGTRELRNSLARAHRTADLPRRQEDAAGRRVDVALARVPGDRPSGRMN